jgi:hypothetical protein
MGKQPDDAMAAVKCSTINHLGEIQIWFQAVWSLDGGFWLCLISVFTI